MADALGYAHGRDVVHRDIKPENILLSAGHAIIADFGIACAAVGGSEPASRLTHSGAVVGTPAYMSPEQAFDEGIDGRTDLFALGCLLFEMLTGVLPFTGATTMAMLAHKLSGAGPVFPPAALAAIPGEITALITRLLAVDKHDRPADAAEVVAVLDSVLRGAPPIAPANPVVSPNAIAVLAFASMSPDPNDEYLADGMSEALTHELGRVAGLRVIARTSAFVFKGSTLDTRTIGTRLGVSRLVEGSVRRSGDRLRVTAKLLEATSGTEIWAERFDGLTSDVFAIEDELAQAVTRTLTALVLAEEGTPFVTHVLSAPPTTSVPAYEQYLKGRYWWGMRTEVTMRRSLEHLEQALQLDPQFVLAAAAMAETLATMGLYGLAAPMDVMPQARRAAERALALDPTCAEALCARACVLAVYDRDWAGATRDFEAAIAANPQYPTSYQWLASTVLVPLGRWDDAHRALARARALDPLSRSIVVSSAAAHYYHRNIDAAIADSREALQLDERFAMGHFFLGLALELRGDLPRARAALEQAELLSPTDEILTALGRLHAASGDVARASVYRQRLASEAAQRYQSPVLAAQIATALGDHDEAVRLLHAARALRAADLIWVGVRPAFDALQPIAGFAALRDLLALPHVVQSPIATFTEHDRMART